MVDNFIIDAVNKVFLNYSPLYSIIVKENTQNEKSHKHDEKAIETNKDTNVLEHEENTHNPDKKEHEKHDDEYNHDNHSEHEDEHSEHEEHHDMEHHDEEHEHDSKEKHGENHSNKEESDENLDSAKGSKDLISSAEFQARLLLGLKETDLWKPKTELADEFKPITRSLESHIFEFQNKFIGADYPTFEIRQLYSAFNPHNYQNSLGDMFFGEHHRANLYTDTKPVYMAMRSEKINITQKSEFKPVYMRMKHS